MRPNARKQILPRDRSDLQWVVRALNKDDDKSSENYVELYEKTAADFFDVKSAFAVTSATAALYAILHSLKINQGDEIIIPVTAPASTVLPLIEFGAIPVFADTYPNSFALDADHADKLITDRTKAVMSVPMFGYPATTSDIIALSEKAHLPLITDASNAFAATVNGKYEGTWGDIGYISTHSGQPIDTEQGGIILTDNPILARAISHYAQHGTTDTAVKRISNHSYGLSLQPTSLTAALGLAQFERVKDQLSARHQNHLDWLDHLAPKRDLLDSLFHGNSASRPSYMADCYQFSEQATITAQEVVEHTLTDDLIAIPTSLGHGLITEPTMKEHHERRKPKADNAEFPNASNLLKRLIVLPTNQNLTDEDTELTAQSLTAAVQGARRSQISGRRLQRRHGLHS